MPDPRKITSHGRANPFGINYMYLADNCDTVIAELKPSIEKYISVGEFCLEKSINVVEFNDMATCGGTIYDEIPSSFICNFMMYLLIGFSSPIDKNKKELEYLPFQYFAEYCKTKEIDGIKFLSSVMSQDNSKGEFNYNYVIFDDKNVLWKKTDVYKVTKITYTSEYVEKE